MESMTREEFKKLLVELIRDDRDVEIALLNSRAFISSEGFDW